MKTLHRYKKVFQNTCLSIICALFFVVSSASPAKADIIKQGTVATTYGSYHWECFAGTTDSPISLGLNIIGVNLSFRSGSGFSFRYNFKDKYSGQITIGVTTSNAWRYIDAYCTVNGGAFNSTPASSSSYLTSHTFTINFEQCEYLEFTVYLDGVGYANYFNSNTTISVAYGRTPTVDDKLTEIDTAIDLYMPGMSSNLSNIASNTATMASDIAILKGYLDGLEGYTDQIEPLLNQIIDQQKVRNSIDIPIYSRFAYINLLRYGTISDQYNYPYSTAQYGFFPTILTSNYSDPAYNSDYDIDVPAGKTLHFIYTISYWANIFDFIDSSSNSLNPTVTMIEGNNYYRTYDISYTNTTSARIWLNVSMNRNVNRPVIPLYLGVTVPQDVAMLFNMDFENTYTRLLQQIATGIGNISQQQIIENNTNINNYNNYQTSINNVENNYYQEFNTYENNIEQNNTFDFTGLSSDGVTVYHNLFTSVFQIDLIKWPLLITLLGLIIVIILG